MHRSGAPRGGKPESPTDAKGYVLGPATLQALLHEGAENGLMIAAGKHVSFAVIKRYIRSDYNKGHTGIPGFDHPWKHMGSPYAGTFANPGTSGNFGVGLGHEDRIALVPNEKVFYAGKVFPLPVKVQGGFSGKPENGFHIVLPQHFKKDASRLHALSRLPSSALQADHFRTNLCSSPFYSCVKEKAPETTRKESRKSLFPQRRNPSMQLISDA